MDRLEKIVEQMESGKLPLEDLIVRYEEGMNLVKICQERLANAEQKIEIIARNSAGKTVVKDFEPTQESPAAAKAVDQSERRPDGMIAAKNEAVLRAAKHSLHAAPVGFDARRFGVMESAAGHGPPRNWRPA